MLVLGVIPARFGSTRFPGKPLAPLAGKPVIAHVVEHAREAKRLDRLVVATDDRRIAEAAREAGAEARLTPSELRSGSDRAAYVAEELEREGFAADLVVNIQGDEPFLPAPAVDRAVERLAEDGEAQMSTLAVPLAREEAGRADVVKVVLDDRERALYFSRGAIPYPRRPEAERRTPLRHVGLYVFRAAYLKRFVALPAGELEEVEGLEQLRALADGARIVVAVGDWDVMGVDTPDDLARAERRWTGGEG